MVDSGSEASDDGWLDDCSSDGEPPVVRGRSPDARKSAPSVLAGSSALSDGTDSPGNDEASEATDGWGVGDAELPRARASAPLVDDAHRKPTVGAAETDAHGGVASNASRQDETGRGAGTDAAYLDFSVKSPWERMSCAVETVARTWLRLTDRELRERSTVNDSRPDHGSRDLRCLHAVIEHDQMHRRHDPYAVLLYFRDDAERPNVLRRREDENVVDGEKVAFSETKRANTATPRRASCVSQRATCAPEDDLSPDSSGLQRWFGAGDAPFAVVEPLSPRLSAPPFAGSEPSCAFKSGTFADVDEATAAKAAVAVAFAAAGVPGHWPVFAPVLGPARRAFVGRTGDDGASSERASPGVGGWCVRYETDSLEGVAAEKASARTVFGLCDVLRAQLAALHGACTADALVADAKVTARLAFALTRGRRLRGSASSGESGSSGGSSSDGDGGEVRAGDAFLAVAGGGRPPRLRGERVARRDDRDAVEAEAEDEDENADDETATRASGRARETEKETLRWDDVAPWAPWAWIPDPWSRVEVHATYRQVPLAALRDERSGLSLEAAPEWIVRAVPRGAAETDARFGSAFPDFSGATSAPGGVGFDEDGRSGASAGDERWARGGGARGSGADASVDCGLAELYYLLSRSVGARAARDAETMGRLASAEFWDDEAATGVSPPPRAPPESVVQDVLRDIFSDAEQSGVGGDGGTDDTAARAFAERGEGEGEGAPAFAKTSLRKGSLFPVPERSAPPDSLLARLALHALVFGNARAVAMLWRRFVREIRFAHWDRGVPLPRTGGVGFEAAARRGGASSGSRADDRPEEAEDERVFRDEQVDMRACVAHQKIQLINACIRRRKAWYNDARERSGDAKARREREARVVPGGWDDVGGGWDDDRDVSTETAFAVTAVTGSSNGRASMTDDRREVERVTKSPDDDIDLVALLGVASLTAAAPPPPSGKRDAPLNAGSVDSSGSANADPSVLETDDDGFETASDGGDGKGLATDEPNNAMLGGLSRAPEGAKRAHPDGLRLLKPPHRRMRVPETQPPPLFTEDLAREREAAMHALGDTPEGRALRVRLQSDQLVSDMSAFKAANPGSCLADFVRWHSPRDWIENAEAAERGDDDAPTTETKRTVTAPNPGKLSARMGSRNNTWKTLWRDAPVVPVSKQKLLFDPIREGERALEYLDTAPPPEIFAQILAAAAAAVGETYAAGAASLAGARVDAPSREALQRAHAMVTHTLARACPYEAEYAAVAGELQRAERAVARAAALARRLPGVCAALREALLAAAAEDEARADAAAAETAEADALQHTPTPRPPPRVVEAVLPRTHPERARGSALAGLIPREKTVPASRRGFEPGEGASESAAHAEYVVRAGGGHAQTHRAHVVAAPCFIRVSSAVAYQY